MTSYFTWGSKIQDLVPPLPVCDAATLAYIDAKINKDSDEMAKAKAANAYVRALAKDPQGDPNGACFEAAQELL